jgi:hypothetical protein
VTNTIPEPVVRATRVAILAIVASVMLVACMEAKMLTSTDEPYGTITTASSNIPAKIYPTWVATIDGKNQQSGNVLTSPMANTRHTFRLSPGHHTIRIVADLRQATGVIPATYTPRSQQPGTIEIFVERGREYYLGALLNGSRSDEWEAVVWKVKDLKNYNHTIIE